MLGNRIRFVLVFGVVGSVESVREIPDPGNDGVTDYCGDGFKCGDENHFACTHKERTVGETVAVVSGRPVVVNCSELATHMTPKERGVVLKAVNDFRNEIAVVVTGGGSDIRQLTWDYELERFARVLATNVNATDITGYWVRVCARTESGNTTAVFYSRDRNATYNVQTMVAAWGHHGENRTKDDMDSLTALASSSATKLGCGFADGKCDDKYITTVACFVGFEVNLIVRPVFKMGTPCGNCPPDTKCNPKSRWPKLCAGPGDPEKPEDIPDPNSASSVHRWPLITPFFNLFVKILIRVHLSQ